MSEKINASWRWADLSPATRSVVALFSEAIGNEPGQLSFQGLRLALIESDDQLDSESVIKSINWGGLEGGRNVLVKGMQAMTRDEARTTILPIGHLAGGEESKIQLAERISEEIIGDRRYDVYPALRVLSELAMMHIQKEQD